MPSGLVQSRRKTAAPLYRTPLGTRIPITTHQKITTRGCSVPPFVTDSAPFPSPRAASRGCQYVPRARLHCWRTRQVSVAPGAPAEQQTGPAKPPCGCYAISQSICAFLTACSRPDTAGAPAAVCVQRAPARLRPLGTGGVSVVGYQQPLHDARHRMLGRTW